MNIDKFKFIAGEDGVSLADFNYWPAWSEYYDYGELEEIAKWGIPQDVIHKQLSQIDMSEDHPYYTIMDLENLPLNNMRIFLKAVFVHKSGLLIDGSVMCEGRSTIPDDGAVCISLFSKSCEYVFNNMFSDDDELRDAERDFNVESLFPLKYDTQFRNEHGDPIRGVYDL